MADLTDAKHALGDTFPINVKESDWKRTEPLLTPGQLRRRHLWGLELVSGIKNRFGKAQEMTDTDLADTIDRAAAEAEVETGLAIFPEEIEERAPFNYQEFRSWGHMKTKARPVQTLIQMVMASANQDDVFEVPLEWIDTGDLQRGKINIVPLTNSLLARGSATNPGPALFFEIFGFQWVPALWTLRYIAGFDDGAIPKIVNDLIGVIAAMDVLSMLAPTLGKNNSASLSLDGLSQSSSGPGVNIFAVRMEELAKRRSMLVGKLKALYNTTWVSDAL